jgi:hypothetical protein
MTHLPFMRREYVSVFAYCSATDCPSAEVAISTQIGTPILISHVFVLPSGICILHFYMLFNSLYYLFYFLSYNCDLLSAVLLVGM